MANTQKPVKKAANLFLRSRRYWIFRYQLPGQKQTNMSLGTYPEIDVKAANKLADQCRADLREGRDPQQVRQVKRAKAIESTGNTFAAVAQMFLDRNGLKEGEANDKKWSTTNHDKHKDVLRRCLLDELGPLPIADITPPMILAVLRTAQEQRGIPSAYEAQTTCKMVFAFAIASSLGIYTNPARDIKAALDPMPTAKHFPALPFEYAGAFLRKLEQANITPQMKIAVRLGMMLVLRSKAFRTAQWGDIDLDAGVWFSPAHKNKGRVAKRVDFETPIPAQAVELLKQLKQYTYDGEESYVFASSAAAGHFAKGSINQTVREIAKAVGTTATFHGFRSTMRDWAAANGYSREAGKKQLAQVIGDATDQAYLRGDFWQQRVGMVEHYANAIEAAEQNLEPVALPRNVRRLKRAA